MTAAPTGAEVSPLNSGLMNALANKINYVNSHQLTNSPTTAGILSSQFPQLPVPFGGSVVNNVANSSIPITSGPSIPSLTNGPLQLNTLPP